MRIGILSHYHNTTNYGGALQAYALCKIINNMGYESEQIDIDCFAECVNLNKSASAIKKVIRAMGPVYDAFSAIRHRKNRTVKKKLQKSFRNFNENLIPHSDREFNSTTIMETLDTYDVFITGSDQVWNPIWYFKPFFLSFVPSEVPKISYAASISQASLPGEVKQTYKKHLEDFLAISVREKNAVDLLHGVSEEEAEYVLDPTLLPEREEWEQIASENLIDTPYVLCYFLGEDNEIRNIAKEYAREHKLTLVNIKHATGQYHKSDINYGDIALEAPSPNEFLSLIKYAPTVFMRPCSPLFFKDNFLSLSEWDIKG